MNPGVLEMMIVLMERPVLTGSALTLVTVAPEPNALWKITALSACARLAMLETLRYPANPWVARVIMTVETERCVLMETASTRAWFKTPVVDLPNATQPAIKPCVDVSLAMKEIPS